MVDEWHASPFESVFPLGFCFYFWAKYKLDRDGEAIPQGWQNGSESVGTC